MVPAVSIWRSRHRGDRADRAAGVLPRKRLPQPQVAYAQAGLPGPRCTSNLAAQACEARRAPDSASRLPANAWAAVHGRRHRAPGLHTHRASRRALQSQQARACAQLPEGRCGHISGSSAARAACNAHIQPQRARRRLSASPLQRPRIRAGAGSPTSSRMPVPPLAARAGAGQHALAAAA
jgi:hypothetical protein